MEQARYVLAAGGACGVPGALVADSCLLLRSQAARVAAARSSDVPLAHGLRGAAAVLCISLLRRGSGCAEHVRLVNTALADLSAEQAKLAFQVCLVAGVGC